MTIDDNLELPGWYSAGSGVYHREETAPTSRGVFIRLYRALDISPDALDRDARRMRELREANPDVKWPDLGPLGEGHEPRLGLHVVGVPVDAYKSLASLSRPLLVQDVLTFGAPKGLADIAGAYAHVSLFRANSDWTLSEPIDYRLGSTIAPRGVSPNTELFRRDACLIMQTLAASLVIRANVVRIPDESVRYRVGEAIMQEPMV